MSSGLAHSIGQMAAVRLRFWIAKTRCSAAAGQDSFTWPRIVRFALAALRAVRGTALDRSDLILDAPIVVPEFVARVVERIPVPRAPEPAPSS